MLQAINCIIVKYCNQIKQSSNKNFYAKIVKIIVKNSVLNLLNNRATK